MFKTIDGAKRRLLRARLRQEAGSDHIERSAGAIKLSGYGLHMEYPDRLVWLNQFIEIFCDDCYGLQSLPEAPRIIDGGANIGTFALCAGWRRPGAEIVAVEPSVDNLAFFRRNIAQLERPVQVLHAALGDKAGSVSLSGTQSDSYRTKQDASAESVPVVMLSSLLDAKVDLLKLDIEGDELAALAGAGEGLSNVGRAVIEVHDYAGRRSDLCEVISHLGRYGFDRFKVGENREFPGRTQGDLVHCCLLHAWRHPAADQCR